MIPTSFCDLILMERNSSQEVELTVQHASRSRLENDPKGHRTVETVPTGPDNLVVKILVAFLQRNEIQSGLKVTLIKRIPAGGGLGGASSDAATALLLANRIYDLNWDSSQLQEFSAEFGSDIAFFIQENAAICKGRGEIVCPLPAKCSEWFVVFRPNYGLATPEVFSRLKIDFVDSSYSQNFVATFVGKNRNLFKKQMRNDLEVPAFEIKENLKTISSEFSRTNPLAHQMSGSGSCYFGMYRNRRSANRAAKVLHNRLKISGTVCHGI